MSLVTVTVPLDLHPWHLDSTEAPHLPPASIPEASGPARAPLVRCPSSGSPTFRCQAGSFGVLPTPSCPGLQDPTQRGAPRCACPCCIPILSLSVQARATSAQLALLGRGHGSFANLQLQLKGCGVSGRPGQHLTIPVDPAETGRSQRSQEWVLLGPLSPLKPRVPGIRGWAVSTLCDQQAQEGGQQ